VLHNASTIIDNILLADATYNSSVSKYMSILENNFISQYLSLLSFNAILIIVLSIIPLPIYCRETKNKMK